MKSPSVQYDDIILLLTGGTPLEVCVLCGVHYDFLFTPSTLMRNFEYTGVPINGVSWKMNIGVQFFTAVINGPRILYSLPDAFGLPLNVLHLIYFTRYSFNMVYALAKFSTASNITVC